MMTAALTAIGFAWLLGVMGVSVLWPRTRPWAADLPVILPLGLGFGFGLTSAIFFGASQMADEPGKISMGLELLVGLGLGWRLRSKWRGRPSAVAVAATATPADFWLGAVVTSILVQACLVAAVASARAYGAEPWGSWDGWAIWNMHARFIFRGGEAWPHLLHRSQVGWTHLDYPLLVPASVARVWSWVGSDAPAASGLVSGMFGAATVGLLIAATIRLRGRLVALAGGLVLLGTPFFVTFSSNEHADIPLGFFILATIALLALSQGDPDGAGWPTLAGGAAGLAAWTKNEGLLFAAVAGLAWSVYGLTRGSRRSVGGFLGGLAVALLPTLAFKFLLAPPNDVVSGQLGERLGHLMQWSRHRLILASLWRDATRFGEWHIAPFLAMALPLLGPGWRRWSGREGIGAVVLAVTLAGYYGVYLLTPWDLAWHLDSSLVRLLLQLWPAAIFCWGLAVTEGAKSDEIPPRPSPTGNGRWVTLASLLVANIAVAAGVLTAFAHQLAPNELAAGRLGDGDVRVVIGDGWYARETDGRNLWVWSKGESTLLVRSSARQTATMATLRFSVRGLGARTVTAKVGARIVWRAQVGETWMAVEIPGLSLLPGGTTIQFTTDAPGVLESPNPGARALTFTIHGVRLK